MFNPDTKSRPVAPCMYVIDEISLPNFLPGVIFYEVSLSLEVWDESAGDIYIDSICFSEGRNFKVFKEGDWMFDNFTKAIYADDKWNELMLDACMEAAE
jgi:hypothetical protein